MYINSKLVVIAGSLMLSSFAMAYDSQYTHGPKGSTTYGADGQDQQPLEIVYMLTPEVSSEGDVSRCLEGLQILEGNNVDPYDLFQILNEYDDISFEKTDEFERYIVTTLFNGSEENAINVYNQILGTGVTVNDCEPLIEKGILMTILLHGDISLK